MAQNHISDAYSRQVCRREQKHNAVAMEFVRPQQKYCEQSIIAW